jgi:UDP-N-acetylmuramoyl-tripeptide--D-alanyl-D-alanine ligase
MHLNKLSPFLKWWVGKDLPIEHVNVASKKRFIRNLIIHPIKRRIAKCYLVILQKYFKLKVIGITGSAGKTTTKDMLTSILGYKGKTVSSYANIDPIYNIPSSIFRCRFNTKYLVLEMGVEYPGEMDFYFWLAHPDVMVITNIYPTHTQFFRDVEGVFKEKSTSISNLTENDLAILNFENSYLRLLENKVKSKIIWYGDRTHIYAKDIKSDSMNTLFTLCIKKNNFKVQIPLFGSQYVNDALAATAVACGLGIKIDIIIKGLGSFSPPNHRSKVITLKNGSMLVDDTYNNNPEAMKAALKSFFQLFPNKQKIIVFGDMLELGNLEKTAHEEIGEILSNLDVKKVICVGEVSKYTAEILKKALDDGKVIYTPKKSEVAQILSKDLNDETAILIKGSRSLGLESVVDTLLS